MRRISSLAVLGLALTAGLTAVSTPALADEFEVHIKLDGLDVNNPADDAAIKERIALAASRACGRGYPLYLANPVRQDCITEITTKALGEIEAIRSDEAIS